MLLTARANYFSEFAETWRDFKGTVEKLPLAVSLAIQDILARYRGSVLGPWWITITTGALILGIGLNYATLLRVKVEEFLPYVAIGLITWLFISSSINEGGESFVASTSILRQSALPLPLFIARTLIRNVINLGHQIVIIVAVMVWFKLMPGIGALWAVLGFVIVMVNLGWISLLTAITSSVFRDVPQIITAVLQFIFFVSPIFWKPSPAMAHNPLVVANPFYFSVQSIRQPLLAGTAPSQLFTVLMPAAFLGWIVTLLIYNQTRRRVVHYL